MYFCIPACLPAFTRRSLMPGYGRWPERTPNALCAVRTMAQSDGAMDGIPFSALACSALMPTLQFQSSDNRPSPESDSGPSLDSSREVGPWRRTGGDAHVRSCPAGRKEFLRGWLGTHTHAHCSSTVQRRDFLAGRASQDQPALISHKAQWVGPSKRGVRN